MSINIGSAQHQNAGAAFVGAAMPGIAKAKMTKTKSSEVPENASYEEAATKYFSEMPETEALAPRFSLSDDNSGI